MKLQDWHIASSMHLTSTDGNMNFIISCFVNQNENEAGKCAGGQFCDEISPC
jgi:hypothetical protein